MECKPLDFEKDSLTETTEAHHSLTSVAWLTTGQFLRPTAGLGQPPLPSWCCISLSCLGLCANWAGALSRLECRLALGQRHAFKSTGLEPLASDVKTLSLGCGNCPLLDIWPLALFKTALTALTHLVIWPFSGAALITPFNSLDDL